MRELGLRVRRAVLVFWGFGLMRKFYSAAIGGVASLALPEKETE